VIAAGPYFCAEASMRHALGRCMKGAEEVPTSRLHVVFHGCRQGCWDWWGYEGDAYAVQAGPQMIAVRRMVGDLLGQPTS
jgi:hypothetical protein